VVVRQRPVAESGDIVAAVIDEKVTIKRFKRIKSQIWLMPENLAHIPVPGNEAIILGKVVAVLRRSLLPTPERQKTRSVRPGDSIPPLPNSPRSADPFTRAGRQSHLLARLPSAWVETSSAGAVAESPELGPCPGSLQR
jgi:Peptidase S24-like